MARHTLTREEQIRGTRKALANPEDAQTVSAIDAGPIETARKANPMINRKILSLCLSACVLFTGCAARTKNVTNLPPGVTLAEVQNWDKEIAALHKIATVTSSLRQGIIGLEKAGAFPDSVAYVKALQAVAKIDQLELAASDYLKQQPEYFGQPQKDKIKGILADIGAEIESINVQSLAGIKNAQTKQEVTALVTELLAVVNLGLSFAQ